MKSVMKTYGTSYCSISRRRFFSFLSVLLMGVSCTPFKLLVNSSPYEKDVKKFIFSFMKAIVPGIDNHYSHGITFYYDPEFPFHKYLSILVSDLNLHSKKRFGKNEFDKLTQPQQQDLIEDRCQDPILKNLYLGVIWFTQVIIYTGMAHPEGKSDILNFEGPFTRQNYSYANPEDYLGENMKENGNLT